MSQDTPNNNPLRQYFRTFRLYTRLPSGVGFYDTQVVSLNDMGEVGVMPMTGQDEILLKNPDALLNGEAIMQVIMNCVPAIKDPKQLLTNDVDLLITAIRHATFNDTLESNIPCPKCQHANSYRLDLQYAIDNMSMLDSQYVINLDSGVSVFVTPYRFPQVMKSLHTQFEQAKLSRSLENANYSDQQRSEIFAKSLATIGNTKFELIAQCIVKVVDESKNINVTNAEFIKEFLMNIDKKSADRIANQIDIINQVGIKKTFTAVCEKCEHSWESEIDFNPTNFS
jgi:hypothetical protein